MKTKIIVATIILTLLSGLNHSFSQMAFNEKSGEHNRSDDPFVNGKVKKSFISHFGEAAENNWSMVGKKYHNYFHSNGLPTYALFTKNGRLIYVITHGTEKNLPADVRKIVKREYYDHAITSAIEVKEDNRVIWVVRLNNASEHITVRVEDGEMEKVQQFQRTIYLE